jgi:ATP-dependent Lon protease
MEVIELGSYTDEEKVEIAKRHLLPKQRKEHGLKESQLHVTDGALRAIIADYTRESGVRMLERELGKLCRKTAMKLVSTDVKQINITEKQLKEYLGVPRYQENYRTGKDEIGLVNGLAWTEVGGEILEVEANVVPGTGKLELTGNLGLVMQESAKAALSCLLSRTGELGIDPNFY